jgi:predicted phosphodiesterase
MIYGVFSDVHGNLEALKVVLDFFEQKKVDEYICCGDIVGYGPQPDACVAKLSTIPKLHCVLGNHDMAVIGIHQFSWFNSHAIASIQYSKSNLSKTSLAFLENCPKMLETKEFTLVHGSPRNPADEYILIGEQFLENADRWTTQICFFGHTHSAMTFSSRRGIDFPTLHHFKHGGRLLIEKSFRYMLNPGSVGQPRDRNPQASCAIYNSSKQTFEVFRLDYPFSKTQELMAKANLPEMLIKRLAKGW